MGFMKSQPSAETVPYQTLSRPGQPSLAYVYTESAGEGKKLPLLMFCPGYGSDMGGTKAMHLDAQCRARGQAYVRFDYSGHGASEGRFEDGTIGQWKQDSLDILNHVGANRPVVLVGSSMGGWIALLVALSWKGPLRGVVGIAAAPDFSEDIYRRMSEAQRKELEEKGRVTIPNHYSDTPYVFTRMLYEDAKKHILLNKMHTVEFPIRLIHGERDLDVPSKTAENIQKAFGDMRVELALVEDGEHRLSRPEDLEIIDREINIICNGPA